MRNRAKCKLCNTIIESFHQHDYVKCKCDEIAVDGGPDGCRVMAKNWDNFLRVDDSGKEYPIKVKEKEEVPVKEEQFEDTYKPSLQDLLSMLEDHIASIERLPPIAMTTPITHYDWASSLILVSTVLRSLEGLLQSSIKEKTALADACAAESSLDS